MKSFNDEIDDDEGLFNGGTFGGNPKDQYFAISRTGSLYIELMGNIVTQCE